MRRTIRYYICLNQISYLMACEHCAQAGFEGSVVLIDPARVREQSRYANCVTRPISRIVVLQCILRSALRRPDTVYVPHHRAGRLIAKLSSLARRTHFLDDGMDTLRDRPKAIDLDRIPSGAELLTFSDYSQLGAWTRRVTPVRICSLEVLGQDDREPLDAREFATVVIESPGILADSPDHSRGERVLYVTHPSSFKNTKPPSGAVVLRSDKNSLERTLANFAGRVVVGETMILPYLLHRARNPELRLEVELSQAQHRNLSALHDLLRVNCARLTIH